MSALTAKGHLKSSKLLCVPDSMIETLQVIRDAAVHGAAVLGVPVKATIKEVHLQMKSSAMDLLIRIHNCLS